jgi:UrcA family protein
MSKEISMLAFHKINLRMVGLLVISGLLFAESGMAVAPGDEAPSVTVRYHDLNLNSPEGVAALYQRIHTAAVDVCKQAEGPQLVDRIFWNQWNDCVAHAVANAVKAVQNEKLSAYYWERTPRWKLRQMETPTNVAKR